MYQVRLYLPFLFQMFRIFVAEQSQRSREIVIPRVTGTRFKDKIRNTQNFKRPISGPILFQFFFSHRVQQKIMSLFIFFSLYFLNLISSQWNLHLKVFRSK